MEFESGLKTKEIWEVSSKITFNVDATTETGLLKQLQQSMDDLKREFNKQQTN